MFGKRPAEKFDPSEFRVHDRRVVHGLQVYVEKEPVEILDYSDGGMRVRSVNPLPRVAVIEIFKNDKLIRNVVAVTAWARGGQTGYAFRAKQKLTQVPEASRSARSASRVGRDTLDPQQNETGGVSGNALRNRLKLR